MKEHFKYVIVGGGIAGTTAAQTIRAADKNGSITIISDEPFLLYSRIMLSKPNFFLGKIPFETIWLKKDSWYADNNIQMKSGTKAASIDCAVKTLTLHDGAQIEYEKLLLAIGGRASAIGASGAEKNGVFVMRTLGDAKKIIDTAKTAKEAVAIGGGFVSFEICDMLRMAGLGITLVIREPYYWQTTLDETAGLIIEEALRKGGVNIIKNNEVASIEGTAGVSGVVLKDGTNIPCQMVVAGVGIYCPFDWIAKAGIKVGRGITTNEFLETNMPDIYSAGDSAEFTDVILGEQVRLGNWVNAQVQGRVAGLNMTGHREPFRLVSFYTTNGFGITIAFVGDARPEAGRVFITRGSKKSDRYGRIIIKDGEIIGATLINRTKEMAAIAKLIERGFKIAGHEKEFGDPDFDLARLL